jgi:hypothetical protein
MLRKLLSASTAVIAVAAFTTISQPVAAGSCAVLSESAVGLKQAEAAERAQKQLARKIGRWTAKNGYKFIHTNKMATACKKTGAVAKCTAVAKVCG